MRKNTTESFDSRRSEMGSLCQCVNSPAACVPVGRPSGGMHKNDPRVLCKRRGHCQIVPREEQLWAGVRVGNASGCESVYETVQTCMLRCGNT